MELVRDVSIIDIVVWNWSGMTSGRFENEFTMTRYVTLLIGLEKSRWMQREGPVEFGFDVSGSYRGSFASTRTRSANQVPALSNGKRSSEKRSEQGCGSRAALRPVEWAAPRRGFVIGVPYPTMANAHVEHLVSTTCGKAAAGSGR